MPTDFNAIQDLVEFDQGITEASKGTPLATCIPDGVDLASWPVTFQDDFSNIAATISNNDGPGPWFANGTYPSVAVGTHATVTNPANPIYTQEPEGLGLGIRRDAGIANWSANITTAVFGVDLDHEPNVTFAQQYGYFEARIRPADPTSMGGANAILWPAFWLYSLSSVGGSIGNLSWKQMELDIVELYNGSGGAVGNDLGHHFAVHFHEPRKWTTPDVWGRDVNTSNYETMTNNPVWGTDANFRFWNDFHTYGLLVTPDWLIFFFDRIEIGRFPMLEELHQKYYLLLSNQINTIGSGGMPDGVQFKMIADYVRVWQNPDWQQTTGPVLQRSALTTTCANANTVAFRTGTPLPSYAGGDGRSFVVQVKGANTGPVTVNANGLGARPVYRLVRTISSSTAVPLAAGDIPAKSWIGLRLDMSLNGGAGGWWLLNPGYSMKMPETYRPPVLTRTHRTIGVAAIEAGLAEKHGIPGALFPAGHPARTPKVVETDIPPRMPVSARHVLADSVTGGHPVGAVTVSNAPTRPVRYALTNADGTRSPYFDVDPATGQYGVRSGVSAVPVGLYHLAVSAWPTTPQPIVPGSNATRVDVDVREDVPFDFAYFEYTRNLQLLFDAQDAQRLTIVSGKVAAWRDASRHDATAVQDDDTLRPLYGATALGGLPAVVSSGGSNALILDERPVTSGVVANLVTRTGSVMSANIHGTTRASTPFDFLSAHIGAVVWSPGACTFWVNGVDIGLSSGGVAGITSSGAMLWVMDAADAGESNLGYVFDTARLFNNSSAGGTLHAALGQFVAVDSAPNASTVDKCFGYLAHRWNLTGLLPASHPYKTAPPRMWP